MVTALKKLKLPLLAKESKDKPTLIMVNTHIGYGAPSKQDSSASHVAPLGKEEVNGLKKNLGLSLEEKFYIPNEVAKFFTDKKSELIKQRKEWQGKFDLWAEKYPELHKEWNEALNLTIPENLELESLEIKTTAATHSSSGSV